MTKIIHYQLTEKSLNFGKQSRNVRIKDNHLLAIFHAGLYKLKNSPWWSGLWLAEKGCGIVTDSLQVTKIKSNRKFLSFGISIQSA